MNKNFKPWKNDKIVHLFCFIEEKKKQNLSLVDAFIEYSKLVDKKPNSIRNYYYNQIEYFNLYPDKAKKLNINLDLHKTKDIMHFSEQEKNKIVADIKNLTDKGYSVRKACLMLANNDIELMMRLQNKYRSYILKEKNNNQNNILQFKPKQKNTLSENDINNLFLGLVKVVKRNAIEQVNSKLINECEWANETLRKTLVSLNEKEQTIKALSLKNTVLSKKLMDLTNEIARLKNPASNNN